MPTNSVPGPPITHEDLDLLPGLAALVRSAGNNLMATFRPSLRPISHAEMMAIGHANEALVLDGSSGIDGLKTKLHEFRPGTCWLTDDLETSPLLGGEWWAVDAVEGNVNLLHGLPEWGVTVTLIRDNIPVIAVAYQPVLNRMYTAVRGHGASLNDEPLRVSTKTDLNVALVTTGQAEAGQLSTYRRIGDAVTAMLGSALLVRMSVPTTFAMLLVASAQSDLFFQYEPVLSGTAAGVLIVTEAGGIATDIEGRPWSPGSQTVVVATPGIHAAGINVLSTVH
jgi:myo-inositol-1(or 4)-monophosphatase